MTTAPEPELTTYRWSSHDNADQFPVEDPATGGVITLVQGGGTAEVNAAVETAHRALQTDWRWHPPAERAALLLEARRRPRRARRRAGSARVARERKPVADARSNDINFLIGVFRFFGSLVDKLPTDFYDKGAIYTSTYLEPLTVIGIVELLNTVLPEDVLHAVPGSGRNVGQPLAGHPLVRMVSFTGSTGAGAQVAGTAAKNITPAVFELGGKDALIIFDDADLGRALKDTLEGVFYNMGEACTASSRILVQDGLYDAFVEQLAAAVTKLKVGCGTDPGVHGGPVVTKTQQQRVLNYIQVGIDEGARNRRPGGTPGRAGTRERLLGSADRFRRRHSQHAHLPRRDVRASGDGHADIR